MDKDTFLTEHKENVRRNRMAQSGFWKWSTLLLLVLMIIGVYTYGLPGKMTEQSQEQASERAVAFLNENLLAGFATASLESATEENDLYKLELVISSETSEKKNATLYVTKDGELLFPSAIDISDFQSEETITEEADIPSREASGDLIVGNPNATLSIVEYSDFECPYCGQVYWTMKLILDAYPEDVKLVYKTFPIPSHENGQKAAEAAKCANLQGKFNEYHDTLFENQDSLKEKNLKQYAEDLGLDTEAFDECLDSDAMAEEVAADQQEGIALGVSSTPTFFIGEQRISGNEKFSTFQKVIEEELAKISS